MTAALRKTIQGHGLGWKPDLPDHNDFKFGDMAPLSPTHELPPRVDLRPLEKPIDDQGSQGSCVGHGVGAAFEMLRAKEKFSWPR